MIALRLGITGAVGRTCGLLASVMFTVSRWVCWCVSPSHSAAVFPVITTAFLLEQQAPVITSALAPFWSVAVIVYGFRCWWRA